MVTQLSIFGKEYDALEERFEKFKESVKLECAVLRKGIFARHNELERSINFCFDKIEELEDRIKSLEGMFDEKN